MLLHLFALPLMGIYLLKARIKGKKVHLKERFFSPDLPSKKGKKRIWFHGVSVGELISLKPLIEEVNRRHPDWEIVISTTTHAGMNVAQKNFPFPLFFFPADFPSVVKNFLKRIQPDLIVIAETELWPNVIYISSSLGIPVVIVNGRISEKSFPHYKKAKFFFSKILKKITKICVQNEDYKKMYLELGAPQDRVLITGNMKADFKLSLKTVDWDRELLLEGEKVIVAGSTMDGEEEAFILDAYERAERPQKLIIAPRHLERVPEVERLLIERKIPYSLRSRPETGWQVLILNSMGELASLYSKASLAIIGGSIKAYGGHNLLEPAYFSVPVAFGPHMENFADLAKNFQKEGGALSFNTIEELAHLMKRAAKGELEHAGKKARRVLLSLQGASKKNADVIDEILS